MFRAGSANAFTSALSRGALPSPSNASGQGSPSHNLRLRTGLSIPLSPPQNENFPLRMNACAAQVLKPPTTSCRSCPTVNFYTLRHQTWPSPVDVHKKLWEMVETMRQTADFALSDWKYSMAGKAEEDTQLSLQPKTVHSLAVHQS